MDLTAPIRLRETAAGKSHLSAGTIVLIAVVFYVCLFSHLGALGLTGPDEPRYASIARAMVESGDWVTPRLNGQVWFEKPVLYYWSAAAAFRVFGVSEFSARLPSALAAALAALTLGWAALRLYGSAAAKNVLLIFPSSVAAIAFARAATMDMLFSAALAVAMVAAAFILSRPRPTAASLAAFGAFLGAAMLAKGPAAVALAGGAVFLWAVGTRRWRAAFRLSHPIAVAAFAAVVLPWYVLCAVRNPDFVRTFFFLHNIERYLTPVFRHRQPFWFFAPILLLAVLPWTVLLIGALRDGVATARARAWRESPGYFLACWAVFPILFFSFSESKLPGYILPAIPPLTLLLSTSLTRAIEDHHARASHWLLFGIGATITVLAAASGIWFRRLPPGSLPAAHGVLAYGVAAAALGGAGVALLATLRRPKGALLLTVLLISGLVEAANLQILPRLDPDLSSRAAAQAALKIPGATDHAAVFRLHRAWRYGLEFYLHRELPEWNPSEPGAVWVYTSASGFAELVGHGIGCTVVWRDSSQAWLLRISDSHSEAARPPH